MLFTLLKHCVDKIDRITEFTGRMLTWCTLLIVLITFVIVLLRYVFNLGWIAMQESVIYFHGLAFMLGAAYTLKHNAHVRVDIFYQRFSPKGQAFVNLCGTLFLLFPVMIFTAIISADYVLRSWEIMEQSSEAGGLPFVYLSKSFILLLCASLLLQGIAEIVRSLLQIFAPHLLVSEQGQQTVQEQL